MEQGYGWQAEDKGSGFRVIFGKRKSNQPQLTGGTILITPSGDDWNDFGLRTRVEVYICFSDDKEYFYTSAFIGFITNSDKEPNGTLRLEEILQGTDRIELAATDSHRFFTMLPSMEEYRQLVKNFGTRHAVEALKAMKDIVALDEFKSTANWLDLATESQVFLKSFLRNSESYYAFKNAGSILRGLAMESFGKLSETIDINFRLPGRKNSHELRFKFSHDSELPKRISVIIGKNGVGKSQALGRIVRASLGGEDTLTDGRTGERVLVNRILAFAPTNEAGSVFPGDRRKRPKIWYKRFSLNRVGRLRKGAGVADQIIQVARSEQYIGRLSRWSIFLNALKAVDNWQELALPVIDSHQECIALKELRRGGEQQVIENFASIDLRREPMRIINDVGYPLSSGEISFVRFAAQASLHVENGSLLLLDEPETHLHPNFVSQFVSLLDKLLAMTGSVAIIATHSAYFVREVFREQVSVLRTDADGYVSVERPTLRTFGADVGAISYFVFGEDEPSRLTTEVEKKLLGRFSTWGDLYSKYKDELSLEVLGSLRESLEEGGRE